MDSLRLILILSRIYAGCPSGTHFISDAMQAGIYHRTDHRSHGTHGDRHGRSDRMGMTICRALSGAFLFLWRDFIDPIHTGAMSGIKYKTVFPE